MIDNKGNYLEQERIMLPPLISFETLEVSLAPVDLSPEPVDGF